MTAPENIRAEWSDGTVARPREVRRLRPLPGSSLDHWEAVFSMEEFPRGLFPAGATLTADGPLGGVELTAIIESEEMTGMSDEFRHVFDAAMRMQQLPRLSGPEALAWSEEQQAADRAVSVAECDANGRHLRIESDTMYCPHCDRRYEDGPGFGAGRGGS